MLNLQIPDRITESMTPNEIGVYMRELREQFKLSLQNVSDRLHVRVHYLEAIEMADLAALPARVYARGYVQSYSEFLGLDPQRVLERFFSGDASVAAATQPVSLPKVPPKSLDPAKWRNAAILLATSAILILVIAQIFAHAGSKKPQAVPEVPEQVLTEMRNMLMPTQTNTACFAEDSPLACIESSREWLDLAAMTPRTRYLVDADLAGVAKPEPESEEKPSVDPLRSDINNPFSREPSVNEDEKTEEKPAAIEKKHEKPKHVIAKPKKKPAVKKIEPTPAHHEPSDPNQRPDHNAIPGF